VIAERYKEKYERLLQLSRGSKAQKRYAAFQIQLIEELSNAENKLFEIYKPAYSEALQELARRIAIKFSEETGETIDDFLLTWIEKEIESQLRSMRLVQ
jgi:hypothetical protein